MNSSDTAATGDLLAVDEGALAPLRHTEAVGQAIVDPAGMRVAALGHGDEDAERRLPACEVARAVERIDDPAIAGQAIENRGVGERGFLADDRHVRDSGQTFREQRLGVVVGDGDHIVSRLRGDLMCRQFLIARQDRLLRDLTQQVMHRLVQRVRGHER